MELIEQEAILEIAEQQGHVTADDILSADIIDTAPVVHGWWGAYMPVLGAGDLQIRCSECGLTHDVRTPYCPNCGARMDGGEDDG